MGMSADPVLSSCTLVPNLWDWGHRWCNPICAMTVACWSEFWLCHDCGVEPLQMILAWWQQLQASANPSSVVLGQVFIAAFLLQGFGSTGGRLGRCRRGRGAIWCCKVTLRVSSQMGFTKCMDQKLQERALVLPVGRHAYVSSLEDRHGQVFPWSDKSQDLSLQTLLWLGGPGQETPLGAGQQGERDKRVLGSLWHGCYRSLFWGIQNGLKVEKSLFVLLWAELPGDAFPKMIPKGHQRGWWTPRLPVSLVLLTSHVWETHRTAGSHGNGSTED